MKLRKPNRPTVLTACGIYLLLWLITAVIGLPHVDRAFDESLAFGSVGFGGAANHRTMPVERIGFIDTRDPANLPSIPETPWRCRSEGCAVAPFLIIDEVAWHDHVLSGFAGRRLVFWFFGFSRAVPIQTFWNA